MREPGRLVERERRRVPPPTARLVRLRSRGPGRAQRGGPAARARRGPKGGDPEEETRRETRRGAGDGEGGGEMRRGKPCRWAGRVCALGPAARRRPPENGPSSPFMRQVAHGWAEKRLARTLSDRGRRAALPRHDLATAGSVGEAGRPRPRSKPIRRTRPRPRPGPSRHAVSDVAFPSPRVQTAVDVPPRPSAAGRRSTDDMPRVEAAQRQTVSRAGGESKSSRKHGAGACAWKREGKTVEATAVEAATGEAPS